MKKIVIGVILIVIALYILIPTPDELFIHSLIGFFISNNTRLDIFSSIVVSVLVYRLTGIILLIFGLLTGKPAWNRFKKMISRKKEIINR